MTRIAIVGVGKIARDAHIPNIASNPDFDLAATVSRSGTAQDGIQAFPSITAMMDAGLNIDAVAICTPPIGRLALLEEAFGAGLDVLLEKPPAATLSEAEQFARLAEQAGRILYMTWHTREAAGIEPARAWLEGKTIRAVRVAWLEDVRVWHPGQEWVWEPGIGVFDPGINALSAITAILPGPLLVATSDLRFPANRAAPIAASLKLGGPFDAPVDVEFDWDNKGPQSWDIVVETDQGLLQLSLGASRLAIDGASVDVGEEPEYTRMYRRFAELIEARRSDVDLSPFRLVADAFMIGRRHEVQHFEE